MTNLLYTKFRDTYYAIYHSKQNIKNKRIASGNMLL